MARIAGVNVPTNKRLEVGLTYVHAASGSPRRLKIVFDSGVDPNTYAKDLTDDEVVN